MKNPFKKTTKKASAQVKAISKAELKSIVGGVEAATSDSGIKITSEKTTTFFHS